MTPRRFVALGVLLALPEIASFLLGELQRAIVRAQRRASRNAA